MPPPVFFFSSFLSVKAAIYVDFWNVLVVDKRTDRKRGRKKEQADEIEDRERLSVI